jgi:hypothetical protein
MARALVTDDQAAFRRLTLHVFNAGIDKGGSDDWLVALCAQHGCNAFCMRTGLENGAVATT